MPYGDEERADGASAEAGDLVAMAVDRTRGWWEEHRGCCPLRSRADATVCVITPAYLNSPWCTAEVAIARSRGNRVLPLHADGGPTHPLLPTVQYADMIRAPETARDSLRETLRRIDRTGGLGWADDRSPFPGLRPFDADLHRAFFGRNEDVEHLAGLLRSPAERANNELLLVVGPSGCGKSSLVRAGLVPMMAEEPGWRTVPVFTPGVDPKAALGRELALLAKELSDSGSRLSDIRQLLDRGAIMEVVDDVLALASTRARPRLLIVMDQLEELFTQTPSDRRAEFATLMRTAAGGPVDVVATLRPEFLDRMLVDEHLASLPTHTHTVRPLRRETLRIVIEGPARLAGIRVADELVAKLVDDTDSGEALPLLAFTLAQLAEGVRRDGELSLARYGELGGVQGALTRQAEVALTEAMAASGRGREEVLAGAAAAGHRRREQEPHAAARPARRPPGTGAQGTGRLRRPSSADHRRGERRTCDRREPREVLHRVGAAG